MYRALSLQLFNLLTCAFLLAGAEGADGARTEDHAPPEQMYATAVADYKARQWDAAARGFAELTLAHPGHELAKESHFLRGEALVQVRKYAEARGEFEVFLQGLPGHRQAAAASFRLGECLLLVGQSDEAATRLEEFRTKYPKDERNAFALLYLGNFALAAGQEKAAQRLFVQSLHDFPHSPARTECRFRLGQCLQDAGKLNEALELFQLVAVEPQSGLSDDACLAIGQVHYEAQDYAAAEESFSAFRTTFAKSPLAPEAAYWLGLSQLAGRKTDAAIVTLTGAAEQLEEAPQAAALHLAVAEALRQAGKAAEAEQHYQLVLDKFGEGDWADDALAGLAQSASAKGDTKAATAFAEDLVQRFPTSPHAILCRLLKIENLLASSRPEDAALLLQQLPALADSDPLAGRVGKAWAAALVGAKKYEAAIPHLQKQLDSAPGPGEQTFLVRSQLTAALAGCGRLDEAVREAALIPDEGLKNTAIAATLLEVAEAAKRAENIKVAEQLFRRLATPGVPEEQRSQALSGLGAAQLQSGQIAAAAATLDRLVVEHPSSASAPEAAVISGQALEQAADYKGALAAYRRVIEKYPQSAQIPPALWGAARMHSQLSQHQLAEAAIKKLLENFPEFAERDAALYELAWVQAARGDKDASLATLARLLQEYPHSEFKPDVTFRLAQQAVQKKEHDRAVALLDDLLAGQCSGALRQQALFLRGQLAAGREEWSEVARRMGEYLTEFPAGAEEFSARYWQAEAAFRRAEYDQALASFTSLEDAARSRTEPWLGVIPLRRAQCLLQQRRWDQAADVAATIGTRYPQYRQQYEADYILGRALGSQGQLDDARLAYLRVVEHPAAHGTETAAISAWMIGECYFQQQLYRQAIDSYERCLADCGLPRWQAASLLQAGKCRLLLNQTDLARRDFERLVANYPESTLNAEARQRLLEIDQAAMAARPNAGRLQ